MLQASSNGSIHPTGVYYCKQLTEKKSSFSGVKPEDVPSDVEL